MEPGLRDREYAPFWRAVVERAIKLQWSPVLETGNTIGPFLAADQAIVLQWSPVLETGNTHRIAGGKAPYFRAAMEPGLRDREYKRGTWKTARTP